MVCLVVLGVRWSDTSGSTGDRVGQLFGDAADADDGGADDPTTRTLVLNRAEQFVLRLFNYGPEDLDAQNKLPEYAAGVRELITPAFATEFDEQVTLAEATVSQAGVGRVAEVYVAGLESIDDNAASALVTGSLTQSYPDSSADAADGDRVAAGERQFRLRVQLVRIEGTWLVDAFEGVSGEDETGAGATDAPTAAPTQQPTQQPTQPTQQPTDGATSTAPAAGADAVTDRFAEIVANREVSVRAAVDDLDACSFPLAPDPAQTECAGVPAALGTAAGSLANSLRGATNPDSRVYVGEPPGDVISLVQRTLSQAVAVDDAVTGLGADCATADTDPCATARTDLGTAMTQLVVTLDAWEAYR